MLPRHRIVCFTRWNFARNARTENEKKKKIKKRTVWIVEMKSWLEKWYRVEWSQDWYFENGWLRIPFASQLFEPVSEWYIYVNERATPKQIKACWAQSRNMLSVSFWCLPDMFDQIDYTPSSWSNWRARVHWKGAKSGNFITLSFNRPLSFFHSFDSIEFSQTIRTDCREDYLWSTYGKPTVRLISIVGNLLFRSEILNHSHVS